VPVPYEDLPVRLPEDLVPDGSGNPLTRCEAFLKVDCPKCGKPLTMAATMGSGSGGPAGGPAPAPAK